jgi:hypothetical protein
MIYCDHAYAHTSTDADKRLPRCLKGSDLVIYSVFKQLGYLVKVVPVIPEYESVGLELHGHIDDSFEQFEDEEEVWKKLFEMMFPS